MMTSLFVRSAAVVIVCLAIWTADANAAQCPATLPAGVIIRVIPDEKLTAGVAAGPTILTVSSDVRFFPNRPPLIPRGSKVLASIVESKQAGRLYGKAKLQLGLSSIVTSDLCEYPIAGKIIEAGRHNVDDDVVFGRGHARRDVIALLFPPTTIYQLLRMPARGPKLTLDGETPLTVKLMESVSVVLTSSASIGQTENPAIGALNARVDGIEREFSTIKASVAPTSPRPAEIQPARVVTGPCSSTEFRTVRPVVQTAKVVRPIRNLTPYHVSVYLDRTPVIILPPCYGPSMISTPTTEFKLEATASIVTNAGQKQIDLKIVPNASGQGWDVLPDAEETTIATAN